MTFALFGYIWNRARRRHFVGGWLPGYILSDLANADIDAEVKRRVDGLPVRRFVMSEKAQVYRQSQDGEEATKDLMALVRKSPFADDPRYMQMQSAGGK